MNLPEMLILFKLALWTHFSIEQASATTTNQTQPTEECILNMKEHITHLCTYPGTKTPCFRSSVEYNGELHTMINLDSLVLYCCLHTEKCTKITIPENFCCTAPDCVDRCYNIERRHKFRKNRHHLRSNSSIIWRETDNVATA